MLLQNKVKVFLGSAKVIYYICDMDEQKMTLEQAIIRVLEFNKGGGQDVTYTPRWIKREDFKKQLAILREEVNEIDEAFEKRDMPEVLDGLADTLYVLLGLVSRLGLVGEMVGAFKEVCDSNDTKIWHNGINVAVFKEAVDPVTGEKFTKIGKPETFEPARLDIKYPYLNNLKSVD